jgi:phosphohistidine phosphatase
MKTLLVLRHAKSSWDDSSLDDHERPLNARGLRDAPRMGQWMRRHELLPDLVISSDAVRARRTADAVAQAVGYTGDVLLDPRLYLASPDDIVEVLRTVPESPDEVVMVVGHDPGLEGLVAQLTGEWHSVPTATLVHLELPIDGWEQLDESTRGALVDLHRPKDLG